MLNSHILYREERDNCCTAVISSEQNKRSNTFDICRNRWLNNGGTLCQSIICAAECDDRKDKGETEWVQRKWDRQVGRVRQTIQRQTAAVKLPNKSDQLKEGVCRFSIYILKHWEAKWKGMIPRLLTSPCEWPQSFVVSLPRFHWAQQWSFLIPEHQKYEVNITTVFANP